jgi:UDP-glucose 4-epimerase
MNITVTGGAGFIGSHLVEKLLQLGHEVITVDDLSSGSVNFLRESLDHPNHTFIGGTVLDRPLIRNCMAKSDMVYHLAAVLGVKNCVDHPLKVIEGNLDGTRVVMEEAYRHHVKVVFASTSEVYGKSEEIPFAEDGDRVLGSTAVSRWCYATAKAMDEHLCFAYMKLGLPVTIIRYFNAYGPRATATAYGGVVPRFIRAAVSNEPLHVYGTGLQQRCFTYVDDIVRGTVLAARPDAEGHVVNIGSQFESSIRHLAYAIKRLTGSSSEVEFLSYEDAYGKGYEDMQRRVPDLTKAGKLLGYQPKVSLELGLMKTIVWHWNEQGATT